MLTMELSPPNNTSSANMDKITNPWYPPPRSSYNFMMESTARLVPFAYKHVFTITWYLDTIILVHELKMK